jgi:fatty acid desaturase
MTTEEERRLAQRQATVYRIMAWTSANRRTLRSVAFAFGALFVIGLLLLFWAPWVGLAVMVIAALPVVLMMLAVGAALVHDQVSAAREQTKDQQ